MSADRAVQSSSKIEVHVPPSKVTDPSTTEVVDRGDAPCIVVDGIIGLTITQGMLRINLFADFLNAAKGAAERVVVAKVAMMPDAAKAVADGILLSLQQAEADGAIAPLAEVVRRRSICRTARRSSRQLSRPPR